MKTEEHITLRELQPGRRRHFTLDEKRALLFEASQRGESLSALGRRYDIAVSLLFRWRRELSLDTHLPFLEVPAPQVQSKAAEDPLERRLAGVESQLQFLLDENRRLMARVRRLERAAAAAVPTAQGSTRAGSGVRDQV